MSGGIVPDTSNGSYGTVTDEVISVIATAAGPSM